MLERVFVGDVGIKFKLYSGLDVTSGYSTYIKYKKPDGSVGRWDSDVEETYYCSYVTESGDLDLAGTWLLQTYIENVAGTVKLHGDPLEVYVYAALY